MRWRSSDPLESDDPRFVSGASLAEQFDVTRSAVWKAVGMLRELGTPVEAVTNQGYRLALPASPLQALAVCAQLDPPVAARLRNGGCVGSVTSTNAMLLARDPPPPGQFDFLTAEHQSAGRGRRGRDWFAPPGGAICLSWSWSFESMASQMGALSLVVGIAALRALRERQVPGVRPEVAERPGDAGWKSSAASSSRCAPNRQVPCTWSWAWGSTWRWASSFASASSPPGMSRMTFAR